METWHGRLKAFLDFLLTRRGQARQRSAMKRVDGGDDFVATRLMPKFSPKLEQAFIRLRAAIAEKDSPRRDKIDNPFREPSLELIII